MAARVIRPVEIVAAKGDKTAREDVAIRQFVKMLKSELPARLTAASEWFKDGTRPKVMVRGDDLDTLEQLQSAIDQAFQTESVVIHDRAKRSDRNRNIFQSASSAIKARPDALFWIHQFKLMEGIDDPCFVAVAIVDLMGNARQLVQQIGRVTRHSNANRNLK